MNKILSILLFLATAISGYSASISSYGQVTNAINSDLVLLTRAGQSNFTINVSNLTKQVNQRMYFTPYDFGAVGDGVADDTTALQTWINTCSDSNVIAFLPPAVGPYFKITSTLIVSNMNGLNMIGTRGPPMVSSPTFGKSRIHQATQGTNAIMVLSYNVDAGHVGAPLTVSNLTWWPAGGPPDGISFRDVTITGEAREWALSHAGSTAHYPALPQNSFGIAFLGADPSDDCCIIEGVRVEGFGTGILVTDAADMSIISSSFGYNLDGVSSGTPTWLCAPNYPDNTATGSARTNTPVSNQILFQTCQISYNYSNQIHMYVSVTTTNTDGNPTHVYSFSGKPISLFQCDVAPVSALAGGALVEGGSLFTKNCNFESYSDTPAYQILNGSALLIEGGGVAGDNAGHAVYSIIASNSSTITLRSHVALGHNIAAGPQILMQRNGQLDGTYFSDTRVFVRDVVGAEINDLWLGQEIYFSTHTYPSMTAGSMGQFYRVEYESGIPFNSSLYYGAGMSQYGGSASVATAVDLLNYFKEKRTSNIVSVVAASNSVAAGYMVSTNSMTASNFIWAADADVQAFITAGGAVISTNQIIKDALARLVRDYKTFNWWNSCDAIYPMVGDVGSMGLNLRDTTKYNLTFTNTAGASTFRMTAYGPRPVDSTSYAYTVFNPSTAVSPKYSLNSAHIMCVVYDWLGSQNIIFGGYDGVYRAYIDFNGSTTAWRATGLNATAVQSSFSVDGVAIASPLLISRTGASAEYAMDRISSNFFSTASANLPNCMFMLWARGNGPNPTSVDWNNGVTPATPILTLQGASIGAGINNGAEYIMCWNRFNSSLGRWR